MEVDVNIRTQLFHSSEYCGCLLWWHRYLVSASFSLFQSESYYKSAVSLPSLCPIRYLKSRDWNKHWDKPFPLFRFVVWQMLSDYILDPLVFMIYRCSHRNYRMMLKPIKQFLLNWFLMLTLLACEALYFNMKQCLIITAKYIYIRDTVQNLQLS